MNTNTDPVRGHKPCGGCGNADPEKVCVGCLHDFGGTLASAPHQPAEVVSDADIKWDMRHIEPHLKDANAAIPVLLQGVRRAIKRALAQQPAPPSAPSGEAVAWLRMKPDGTPDWAEDCIGSDDKFLDHEMASDGYYLQPLYAAPQQPAGELKDYDILWDMRHIEPHLKDVDKAVPTILRGVRKAISRALATQHQEPTT